MSTFPISQLELMIQTAIPTVYEKGMSYYEVLSTVIQKVNELTTASNAYFNEDIETHVTAILEDWHASGYLNIIINQTLQTQMDALETSVNGTVTSLTASVNGSIAAMESDIDAVESTVDMLKNETVNVVNYGATGDGVTDDTAAFTAAIAAVAIGGSIIIPTPAVRYKLTDTLIIDKPLRIVGSMGLQDFVEPLNHTGNVLEFAANVLTGLDIRSESVELEGFTVDMLTTSASAVAGVYYNVNYPFRFMLMRRMVVHMASATGACIKGKNILVSKFDGVQAHGGLYGFWIEEATTLHFTNCWAMNQVITGIGYKFYTVTYSVMTGCAADSTPHGFTGYKIDNCQAVTLIGCGSEQWQVGFSIWGSFGITLIGCLSAINNALSNYRASFLEIDGFCGPVTVDGCRDLGQIAPTDEIYVYPNAQFPRIMSCSFTKVKHDIVTVAGDLPEVARANGMLINVNDKEGRMMILKNANGVADQLFIAMKGADNAIAWKQITVT